MPVYEGVDFAVEETEVEGVSAGFTTVYDGSADEGFHVTNTLMKEETETPEKTEETETVEDETPVEETPQEETEDDSVSISISKVDVANGEELEGAHIQVLDKNDDVVEEWTSTKETYRIEGLEAGETYTLRETVAPEGYDVTTDIAFAVNADDSVVTKGKTTTDEQGHTVLLVEDAKKETTQQPTEATTAQPAKETVRRNANVTTAGQQVPTAQGGVTKTSSLLKTGDVASLYGALALALGGATALAGIVRRRK